MTSTNYKCLKAHQLLKCLTPQYQIAKEKFAVLMNARKRKLHRYNALFEVFRVWSGEFELFESVLRIATTNFRY